LLRGGPSGKKWGLAPANCRCLYGGSSGHPNPPLPGRLCGSPAHMLGGAIGGGVGCYRLAAEHAPAGLFGLAARWPPFRPAMLHAACHTHARTRPTAPKRAKQNTTKQLSGPPKPTAKPNPPPRGYKGQGHLWSLSAAIRPASSVCPLVPEPRRGWPREPSPLYLPASCWPC